MTLMRFDSYAKQIYIFALCFNCQWGHLGITFAADFKAQLSMRLCDRENPLGENETEEAQILERFWL